MTDRLEIRNDCCFEYTPHWGVTLNYVEHQADHWYSDTHTEIDINKEKAQEIVDWLTEKFDL